MSTKCGSISDRVNVNNQVSVGLGFGLRWMEGFVCRERKTSGKENFVQGKSIQFNSFLLFRIIRNEFLVWFRLIIDELNLRD